MKIRLKLSAKKIIKYTLMLVFLSAVGLTIYTAVYLYNNFYLVITQSQDVVLSDEKRAIDTINIRKFETVIRNIENKTNPSLNTASRNIFR